MAAIAEDHVPALQELQAIEPAEDHVPALHVRHNTAVVAAIAEDHVPALQVMQDD